MIRGILLEKYKTIYLIVYKNASTSMRYFISKQLGIGEYDVSLRINNFPYIGLDKILELNNYKKFSIIRNPYARLLSGYLYFNKYFDVITNKRFSKDFLNKGKFYKNMSFSNFVFEVYKNKLHLLEEHLKPQYLSLINKNIKINYLARLENFDIDFIKICKLLGINNTFMPFTNTTYKKERSFNYYRNYFDYKTAKLATDMYKRDLILFNYRF